MKIVSKAELRKMPVGTLYVEYREGHWPDGPDSIFLGDIEYMSDFLECGIGSPESNGSSQMFDRQDEMDKAGAQYPVSLACGREGYYDDSMRYLVWDEADVREIAVRTAWFAARQREWNGTSRFRVIKADGSIRYETDEDDARRMARPGDTVERLYERHEGEWRPAP